jgi:predicted NAD/FAD-dependent oxidoreductase
VLADNRRAGGSARLGAQYFRANTIGSERYVLTTAGSVADRLGADESGVQNLVMAGDWTSNGVDGGCVEAAMTSGMQAARALIGHARNFTGESPTWLTD